MQAVVFKLAAAFLSAQSYVNVFYLQVTPAQYTWHHGTKVAVHIQAEQQVVCHL